MSFRPAPIGRARVGSSCYRSCCRSLQAIAISVSAHRKFFPGWCINPLPCTTGYDKTVSEVPVRSVVATGASLVEAIDWQWKGPLVPRMQLRRSRKPPPYLLMIVTGDEEQC